MVAINLIKSGIMLIQIQTGMALSTLGLSRSSFIALQSLDENLVIFTIALLIA